MVATLDNGGHAHHLPTGSLLDETDVTTLRDGTGGLIENLEEMLRARLTRSSAPSR